MSRAVLMSVACLCCGWSMAARAECQLSESAQQLDPVEVGYCEADAVFVGQADLVIETQGAHTEPGSDRTRHFSTQRTTMKVTQTLKGEPGQKLTMVANLYDKGETFVFESQNKYLVFAKRLPGEGEFSAASAKCSVQPPLRVDQARKALKQLELNKSGLVKIDCEHIRPKQKPTVPEKMTR